jgi:heterodisulfide reductase subunit A
MSGGGVSDQTYRRRIGVFICRCGKNIAQNVDVSALVDIAGRLPWVVHAEENVYTCSDEGLSSIIEKIGSMGLTRVVVASCTPRTHEPLFRETVERAGLNKYLFEFVNIREQCSWIHPGDAGRATRKAADLIAMGVARAATLRPEQDIVSPVLPAAIVIGGGVSGMKAALTLSALGASVHLVEKESRLGGFVRSIAFIHPSMTSGGSVAGALEKEVMGDGRIAVHLSSTLAGLKGYVGSYEAVIRRDGEEGSFEETVGAGVIVVAAGAEPFDPEGLFLWRQSDRVVTSAALEEEMRRGNFRGGSVVMLNCAALPRLGSGYCGRICCTVSLKQAAALLDRGASSVTILGRNQMVWGEASEGTYRKALEMGVRIVRFEDGALPSVEIGGDGRLRVGVRNLLSGEEIVVDADNLVLGVPLVPHADARDLARLLKVPLEQEGFFKEKHPKLAPVEFSSSGIVVCGSCRFPSTVAESIAQGSAAGLKAAVPVRAGRVTMDASVAATDERLCSGCGWCVEVCPYGGIALVEGRDGRTVARVNEAVCKGCGSCAAACPAGIMDQRVFGDREIRSMIGELAGRAASLPAGDRPLVLVFACNWCSYAGADLAGVSRFRMPSNFRMVRVMCSGRVRPEWILEALASGIDGVLVLGCHPGECHYEEGNVHARRRIETLRKLLPLAGIDERRVRIDWVSASEGKRFQTIVEDMVRTVASLDVESREGKGNHTAPPA